MVYWNRFISYIYRYHGGEKCENAGFAKVAKTGRMGKLTVGLKDGMNRQEEMYEVYIYRETLPMGDVPVKERTKSQTVIPIPVSIGRMCIRGGHGEEQFSFDWNDVAGSGRPITAFAGIAIRRTGTAASGGFDRYEDDMFCSSWTDSRVDYSGVWRSVGAAYDEPAADEPPAAITAAAASDEQAHTEAEVMAVEALPSENDKCEEGTARAVDEMFDSYERLPLLPAEAQEDGIFHVIESVKITPNDIGLLDMANWKLGVNSFLTHGYYSYKYLMLGKVVFTPDKGNVSYILGVPGIYSSREKYLAGIFGFERFVSEKETQVKTGSFGYWIVDIR